jgi:hypothetical protein
LHAFVEEVRGNLGQARLILDRIGSHSATAYRESPRYRYARWPGELFAEERRRSRNLAAEHMADLARALAALPDRGWRK